MCVQMSRGKWLYLLSDMTTQPGRLMLVGKEYSMEEQSNQVLAVLKVVGEVGALSTVVFAGTAWAKQLGLKGRWLTVFAFAFGVLFGGFYRWAMYPLVVPADYFFLVTFGLLSGFLATGAYKGVQSATEAKPPAQPPAGNLAGEPGAVKKAQPRGLDSQPPYTP